jgi:hypothetical protein
MPRAARRNDRWISIVEGEQADPERVGFLNGLSKQLYSNHITQLFPTLLTRPAE